MQSSSLQLLITLLMMTAVCLSEAQESTSWAGNVASYIKSKLVCQSGDLNCYTDIKGYSAIAKLFTLVDHNSNGRLEPEESKKFVDSYPTPVTEAIDAVQSDSANDRMDMAKLWKEWTTSEAYKWGTVELIDWLYSEAGISEYDEQIEKNEIRGIHLARFTEEDGYYLRNVIGIENDEHIKKIRGCAINFIILGKNYNSFYLNLIYVAVLVTSLLISRSLYMPMNLMQVLEEEQQRPEEMDNLKDEFIDRIKMKDDEEYYDDEEVTHEGDAYRNRKSTQSPAGGRNQRREVRVERDDYEDDEYDYDE